MEVFSKPHNSGIMYYTKDPRCLCAITVASATRLARAGLPPFADNPGACFGGTGVAFSGLFKELPGEVELIPSFSAD